MGLYPLKHSFVSTLEGTRYYDTRYSSPLSWDIDIRKSFFSLNTSVHYMTKQNAFSTLSN